MGLRQSFVCSSAYHSSYLSNNNDKMKKFIRWGDVALWATYHHHHLDTHTMSWSERERDYDSLINNHKRKACHLIGKSQSSLSLLFDSEEKKEEEGDKFNKQLSQFNHKKHYVNDPRRRRLDLRLSRRCCRRLFAPLTIVCKCTINLS